jgi:hypothetical protein
LAWIAGFGRLGSFLIALVLRLTCAIVSDLKAAISETGARPGRI